MTSQTGFLNTKYGGYLHNQVPPEDEELTHVGPGTPGGEWLRRFWHPVAVAEDLKDLPKAIRILGEDLVIFRDKSGQVGLLELHCSHRGTSLEFAQIEERGIRCCYHAWCFDVDGKILDTPGEPADSTLKDRLYHGAYPTLEHKGLIFAYMGPPDKRPAFPMYDTYEITPEVVEGPKGTPLLFSIVQHFWPANWLQIRENAMDPSHFFFLHSMYGGSSWFSSDFARPGEWDYIETPSGILCIDARRAGDKIWVLVSECIPPNFNQTPNIEDSADQRHSFTRIPWLSWWTVPIDDTHTMHIGYWYAREDEDRRRDVAPGLRNDRPLEERQLHPGDYDAQVSQRPIEVHDLEHLANTDRGIIMLRNMIRRGIKDVKDGKTPFGVSYDASHSVPTYTHDRVVNEPPAPTEEEDRLLVRDTGRKVAEEFIRQSLKH